MGSKAWQNRSIRSMLISQVHGLWPSRHLAHRIPQALKPKLAHLTCRRGRCSVVSATLKEPQPSNNGDTRFAERIEDRDLQKEASESYFSYAVSVVVGRALPDVRDGLKPVHRRILYAMHELGLDASKPHRKSARVVGEVLGKFHPHGDSAVYQALVRMAQDFSMRAPLVSGHGNFGSVDNDPAAAMRYTECRLEAIAMDMLLSNLGKNAVNLVSTFDGSMEEPSVLPSKIPNLLVNGSSGIAVGMATKIPPHNLNEVIQALKLIIQDPDVSIDELMEVLPAPDFPTGGQILQTKGIYDAYTTGKGAILMRGKAVVEDPEVAKKKRGKKKMQTPSIVITELPYQICKSDLVETIADLAEAHTLEGISGVRDESDRDGIRVVVDVKRGAEPEVILNGLYKHTKLQTRFSCNMVALVDGVPKTLNLKNMLEEFLKFRCDVVKRRSVHLLKEVEMRMHIVEGFMKALASIDKVIVDIRSAKNAASAKKKLRDTFELSPKQAQAILDMPLGRLTSIESEKLQKEHTDLLAKRDENLALIRDRGKVLQYILKEVTEFAAKFG